MNSYFSGRYRLLSYLLILLLQFMGSIGVEAQQFYPVQVRSYVQSPSVFIEDYKDPNNFRVQVTLTDLTVPSLDVNLKVFFKGPSSTFESVTGIPLHLLGGVTYTLNREDLELLLSPVNLPGAPTTIPEGTYVISFRATERNSNTPVSNTLTDFTSVVIMLNDPPLLTSPAKGEMLDLVVTGQNFMFSWTPRSFSLNPQEQIKYRLTLALIPPDRNPYDAFLTNAFNIIPPFENIQYNSFFYDQSMLPLIAGATYAWQVQAYEEKLVNGVPQKISQRFRNEGKSDVFVFKVKEFCPPLFLKTPEIKPNPATNKQEIILAWNKDPEHKLYEVKYRIQGSVLPWTVVQQREDKLILGEQQLLKGKTYEYTVACQCTGWQEALDGGTFMLPAGECEAPFPILVSSNDQNGIALSWTKVTSANTYNVYYTDNNTKITSVKEGITDGSVLVPALSSGSYTIHVDAVCGPTTAAGENLELKFDEKYFPGSCPVPSPFTFLAKRPGAGTDPLSAQLSWPKLDLHESFKLTYWHKDSVNYKHTQNSLTPEALATGIKNNEFYNYTIQFICKGGKSATTPQGGFRLEGGGSEIPLDPPTADCFPPAVHSAEPKSETTARIDWKGISGAEEYVVVYKPKDGSGQEKTFTTTAANAKLTDLTPGTIYQYKIRCKCGGKFSIDSEPGEFDLSKSYSSNKCDSISNLKIKQITETEIQLSWPYPQPLKSGYDAQTSYTIRYKENGQVWSDAYPINFVLTSELQNDFELQQEVKKTINQLSPGVRYDIEVKARCGTEDARANEPLSGTTKELKEADCSQGGSCDRSSSKPLEDIKVGDTIGVADYKVKIKTIIKDTKGTNLWKGTGIAETPMVGFSENVKFNVTFDSLFVNDKVCVTGGNLKVDIGVQIFDDATTAKIKGIVDDFGTALNDAKQISKDLGKGIDDAQKAGEDALGYFQGGDDVGHVKTGGLGDLSTTASNFNDLTVEGNSIKVGGKSYPVSQFPVLVKDSNGNVISVKSDGSKTEVGHYDESLKGLQNSPVAKTPVLTFKANPNAIYSFDAWQKAYGESVAMEPHYLSIDENYYSAKAITPGAVDKVDFDLVNGDKSKLIFVNRDGFVFKTLSSSTLQLVGGPAKDAQEVLALYDNGTKKELVGALLLASYPILEKKVKLVTLAMGSNFNRNIKAIEEQLDKAYNPIGINYTIEVDNSFDQNKDWCEGKNCDDFKTGGSGLLNNDYTGVEARVIDAYINFKGETNLEKETAYMFVVGVTKAEQGDEALQGKMNFAKQFGFLYSAANQSPQTLGRTLAHELGHGNYKLYHIFDKMYLGDAARNSDNLMSYNTNVNALALNKLQWDVAHDPGVTWGVFKRDDDQEAKPKVGISDANIGEFLEQIHDNSAAGLLMSYTTANAGEKKEFKNNSVKLNDGNTYSITLTTEAKSASNTFNPILYEDYYYDAWGPYNDYGFSFKDVSGNKLITIVAGSEEEKNKLKLYLFGKQSHSELLDKIHSASAIKSKFNLTFSNGLKNIEILEKFERNGVVFDKLYCSFQDMDKGSYISIAPNDPAYRKKTYGFDIIVNEKTVYYIHYFKENLSDKDYEDNLKKLEDWLFGGEGGEAVNTLITFDQMKTIFSNGDNVFIQDVLPFLNKYMNKFEINTPCRIAHFLAQIGKEVGYFKDPSLLKENLKYTKCNIQKNLCQQCYSLQQGDSPKCPSNKSTCSTKYSGLRLDMCDNPNDYKGDDEKIALAAYNGFMGRGFIHLTWETNYKKIYDYLILKGCAPKNYLEEPKYLSNDYETAAMSACAFFEKNGCNTQADADNFDGVMNIVNSQDSNKEDKRKLLKDIKEKLSICQ